MTAGLETFAKVRALHDRATIPGEKLAAAGRMEALARSAGMSVPEALSKLDAAPPQHDLAAAARAWAERYEAAAEAATRDAGAPEAPSQRRGLPIYDPNKVEPWRDVAEHCLQLDWTIPKAHGGKFLTKAERERLKTIARRYGPVTNATAAWMETVLARCEVARASWRDRGKAGVRPDRKATESDIEKAAELVAAAKRREASKLDNSESETPAQAAASAFNDFFNSPKMRAKRAEMDREREARRAEILKRYGSRKAVYAETEREAALRTACAPMTSWRRRGDPGSCTLDGWDWLQSREKVPARVRSAVEQGWPLPQTVKEAWAEYIASEERESERQALHDYEHFAAPWVEVRRCILEDLLDSLPAHSIGDMLVRQSWLEHLNERGFSRDVARDTVLLATQRADIERMGERIREQDEGEVSTSPSVQSGQPEDHATQHTPSGPASVQSGHPHRTNADKRRDVIALLNADDPGICPLTDREIARRAGVSPTTVGTIRRTLA